MPKRLAHDRNGNLFTQEYSDETPREEAIRLVREAYQDGNPRLIELAEAHAMRVTGHRTMTKTDEMLEAAKAALYGPVAAAHAAVKSHEREREKLPPDYYERERQRLVREAQGEDAAAMQLIAAYQAEGYAAARVLRTTADATVDPQERLALLAEKDELRKSDLNGEEFIAQARDALAAGFPERAKMLLGVAESKRARPAPLDTIASDVETALDEKVPDRKAARDIEKAVGDNGMRLITARLVAARDSGLGVMADGTLGSGLSGDTARADVARKMTAFVSGGDFSDKPEPSGKVAP
jgi:hypothetical protein